MISLSFKTFVLKAHATSMLLQTLLFHSFRIRDLKNILSQMAQKAGVPHYLWRKRDQVFVCTTLGVNIDEQTVGPNPNPSWGLYAKHTQTHMHTCRNPTVCVNKQWMKGKTVRGRAHIKSCSFINEPGNRLGIPLCFWECVCVHVYVCLLLCVSIHATAETKVDA